MIIKTGVNAGYKVIRVNAVDVPVQSYILLTGTIRYQEVESKVASEEVRRGAKVGDGTEKQKKNIPFQSWHKAKIFKGVGQSIRATAVQNWFFITPEKMKGYDDIGEFCTQIQDRRRTSSWQNR